MTTRRLFLAAAVLGLSLSQGTSARAQDDFKPLFNGKDLTGWITPDNKGLWSVENGEIVGRTKEGELKKNEFLVLAAPQTDFVLKAKAKILGGNSGIQVRSKRADDGAVAGPQVDIADGYFGVLYDERGTRGIIERYDPAKAEALAKKADWNDFVITLKGNHLKVELNGTTILDRKDDQFPKTGHIALQVHAGPPMEVRFKDVVLKKLD